MTSPLSLMRYDQARSALAECRRIDEVKDIADKALALAAYARQIHDPDMECWVAEIRVRARRRLGELSAALETARGKRQVLSSTGKKSDALAAAGISLTESHRCELLARVPAEQFDAYIALASAAGKAVTADEVVRQVVKRGRRATVSEAAESPTMQTHDLAALTAQGMKFGTVLADPPWRYGNQSTRGATSDHYVGMSVDEIAALPIASLAADRAHLHLWTTNAFLFDAPRIMAAWGFDYRSCFVWVKPSIGMGNYWRVSHEFLLLGVRGSCPFADRSLRSWGEFSRGAHSAKPEEIRHLIEKASPGPRLELFGRRCAPGWVVWGNEVERTLFDDSVQELVA